MIQKKKKRNLIVLEIKRINNNIKKIDIINKYRLFANLRIYLKFYINENKKILYS